MRYGVPSFGGKPLPAPTGEGEEDGEESSERGWGGPAPLDRLETRAAVGAVQSRRHRRPGKGLGGGGNAHARRPVHLGSVHLFTTTHSWDLGYRGRKGLGCSSKAIGP